jgi:hypothetical protein
MCTRINWQNGIGLPVVGQGLPCPYGLLRKLRRGALNNTPH